MRDTLLYIPHKLFGIPLFGFGLLLVGLIVAAAVWIVWTLLRRRVPGEASPASELWSGLPVWLVAAAIVTYVLPLIEQAVPNGEPIGLPIRGYGVMVLLGLLAGIGITICGGKQLGIVADVIIGLGFWMMLGGIAGARMLTLCKSGMTIHTWICRIA